MHDEHRHTARQRTPAANKPNQDYSTAISRLRARALRITEPRKAMLHILATTTTPVSVENLHHTLGNGTADLVTVYRSIEAFEKAGIVQRHPLESGKNLYSLTNHAHHHHIMCRECGRIDNIDGCAAERFEKEARKLGYKKISHVFEIYGVCESCAKSRGSKKAGAKN
ncbi:MAG: transcriptional repressor [Puniceicoccales bacterium]|jgi:Fur family ferric uptake transcriptional regulator|nr:transcriptional repressor [Puniceicoccales bacterium]